MTEIIENFDLDRCDNIPDHRLLFWESELFNCDTENINFREQISSTEPKTYNVSNLPSDFLNNREATILIERTFERIVMCNDQHHGTNDAYSAFTDLIHSEMDAEIIFLKYIKKRQQNKM